MGRALMGITPEELRSRVRGLLSFPVSPFTLDDQPDLPRYRDHIRYLLDGDPGALFVCGGTGEFFSLDLGEYEALVRTAVEEVNGRVPVIAGVGYGAALAGSFAQVAEASGVDGLLVLPPYLLQVEQEGLYEHYQRVAQSTRLGLILYQRDNALFAPETIGRLAELPQVIGFKDGHGDMERLLRIRAVVGDRLLLFNGMPTAELSAPAFRAVGAPHYSSAVYNFVPEIARAYHEAVERGDVETTGRLLNGFYIPFARLRDRVRGYAVSLIKAGMRARGRDAGHARPPLVNPTPEHGAELGEIIEQGLSLLQERSNA